MLFRIRALFDLEIQVLDASLPDTAPDAVTSGSLDSRFGPFNYRETRRRGGAFWLRLRSLDGFMPAGAPAVTVT